MRIRCVLFGCWCDQNSSCPKCGAALYDADFIQVGRMDWVHRVRGFLLHLIPHLYRRCEVCDKRFWSGRHGPCCSKECADEWLPF